MTLYSQPLGEWDGADNGVIHTLYTVPAGQGPAVVRSLSIRCNAGGLVIVSYRNPAGSHTCALGAVDATGAPNVEVASVQLYQPMETGAELLAEQITGAAQYWSVVVGGYQFSTP